MSSADNIHDLFEPDVQQMRAHLEKMFKRARIEYPDGLCEIAYTDHTGQINQCQMFRLSPEELDKSAEFAAGMNRLRRNIYFGVNPRKPSTAMSKRPHAEDVEWALFNCADVDKGDGPAKLRAAPLPYTFVVMTGRKPSPRVHAYWERAEPTTDMVEWSRMQGALRDTFNGDSIVNPDRVMRLAGSINYPLVAKKLRDGHQIELTTLRTMYDGAERTPVAIETLRQVYPAQPSLQSEWQSPGQPAVQPRKLDWDIGRTDPEVFVRNIRAGQELHNNALRLAAHLVMTGHRDWLIRDYLTRLLEPVSDGGTLRQIDEFIASERRKTGTREPTPEEEEDFSAPPEPKRLPLEWFGDVQPSLNASDFVEGLLCETGMSVVYGESNCGKTFFMTDLAFHVAAGRRWRGRDVEQGGVIYVALEGGFGIRNRLAALRQHYGPDGPIPFGIVPYSINMLDANADTGPLIELVKDASETIDLPVSLVVIDTLSRAMNGGNENAPEDMGKLVKSADRIREQTGAHVAFVHHSGKDQARGARGHSSLRAATDTEIEITREPEATCSVATVTKQRELEIDGEFAFTLQQISLGANKRGKEVTSCIVAGTDMPEREAKSARLSDMERGFLNEIRELVNRGEHIELVEPERGMPVLRTVTRAVLRSWLIKRGKLFVTDDVTGTVTLSGAEKQRLYRVLNALNDKGTIGMNLERVWLL